MQQICNLLCTKWFSRSRDTHTHAVHVCGKPAKARRDLGHQVTSHTLMRGLNKSINHFTWKEIHFYILYERVIRAELSASLHFLWSFITVIRSACNGNSSPGSELRCWSVTGIWFYSFPPPQSKDLVLSFWPYTHIISSTTDCRRTKKISIMFYFFYSLLAWIHTWTISMFGKQNMNNSRW